jgi:hypothetical protein
MSKLETAFRWFLAGTALLEIAGSFLVLTLGDLWTALRGKPPLGDQPWDPDTCDRS